MLLFFFFENQTGVSLRCLKSIGVKSRERNLVLFHFKDNRSMLIYEKNSQFLKIEARQGYLREGLFLNFIFR